MLTFPFSFMKENYMSSKIGEPTDFVTEHWNVFGNNFSNLLDDPEKWSRMLRNAITLGLNDTLVKISNKRFLSEDNEFWHNLRDETLKDLLDDPIDDDDEIMKLKNFFHETAALTSPDYVINNVMKKICAPIGIDLEVSYKGKDKLVFCNQHDLDDIYHSWEILSNVGDNFSKKPVICEIGSGYGGLITKIKTNLKNAKCVLLDLPEVNVIQSYYLSNVFKDAKFLGYKDYMEKGSSILKEDFDFLILPGWVCEDIFLEQKVDLFINIRSFMEMPKSQIKTYFDCVHRSLRLNGIFACFNRYSKAMKVHGKEFNNYFREYPFDNNWSEIFSKSSPIQPSIHLLLVKRGEKGSKLNFREKLYKLSN